MDGEEHGLCVYLEKLILKNIFLAITLLTVCSISFAADTSAPTARELESVVKQHALNAIVHPVNPSDARGVKAADAMTNGEFSKKLLEAVDRIGIPFRVIDAKCDNIGDSQYSCKVLEDMTEIKKIWASVDDTKLAQLVVDLKLDPDTNKVLIKMLGAGLGVIKANVMQMQDQGIETLDALYIGGKWNLQND